MKQVALGKLGLNVSRMGLGCLWMAREQTDEARAAGLNTLRAALEFQVNFWDTADIYGSGANERFLADTLKTERNRIRLASKCGISGSDAQGPILCGRPSYIQRACRDSLKRLGTDFIDLFYLHGVDPEVPVEESIGSMGELVDQGLVRYLGIRTAHPETVQRAHSERPLSVVQADYNFLDRAVEAELLPVLKELEIGFVASSPLERGLLTGRLTPVSEFSETDPRISLPRFSRENRTKNLKLIERLRVLAEERGLSLSQLALAWFARTNPDLALIPGTLSPEHLEQNVIALDLEITPEEFSLMEFMAGKLKGAPYPETVMKVLS